MKFVHRFNRKLQCEIEVADDPPPKGQMFVLDVQWTGQPKQKHLREYMRWCHPEG
jgi:hypothetical protein